MTYDFSMIRVGIIDIETEMGDEFCGADNPQQQINAISLLVDGEMTTWSLYDVEVEGNIYCPTERNLLQRFLSAWRSADLDIISGWNSISFDMPYVAKRIEMVLGEERLAELSPFGAVNYKMVETKYGQQQTQVEIHGLAQLDLLELYRKFVLQKQESYKLDFIANKELGVGKLEFEGTLKELYEIEENRPTFINYNRMDVQRTYEINQKRTLIENAVGLAYTAKCQYEDAFLSTRPWDVMIANDLIDQKIVVPFESRGDKDGKFEGAFVKDPIIGYHEWMMSFDLGSLYPSIKIAYNISPDTILPTIKWIRITPKDVIEKTELYWKAYQNAIDLDATLCANGALYSKKKQGFMPKLVERVLVQRKVAKRAMMDWGSEAERVKKEIESRSQK